MKRILPCILAAFALACSGADPLEPEAGSSDGTSADTQSDARVYEVDHGGTYLAALTCGPCNPGLTCRCGDHCRPQGTPCP
ncbi:hypothetical protein [Pyxidicoccus sp. MSG2]|uniref:hypothetical protein n=1 Tax=Pyxidicoccus sp. MSG2 TaxID=2996790 RepID=UPI0022718973|nr:hypothetical protein [Pyxidicoccus sp. MSG2]MCY1021131.1 hypothetical protein [Pyxidicoccus sp. MSG2]